MNNSNLSQQAKNCIDLYRGNAPATIKQALTLNTRVTKELQKHFGISNLDSLAQKLATM